MRRRCLIVFACCLLPLAFAAVPSAQQTLTPAEQQRRKDLEAKLHDIAVVERRVMMPMKDGVR